MEQKNSYFEVGDWVRVTPGENDRFPEFLGEVLKVKNNSVWVQHYQAINGIEVERKQCEKVKDT